MRIAVCLALLGLGRLTTAAPAESGERTLSVAYEFPQPIVQLREDRATVTVAGCDTLNQARQPALPFQTAKVLLPPGCRLAKVETRASRDPILLPGTWSIPYGRSLARPRSSAVREPGLAAAQPSGTASSRAQSPSPAERAQLVSVQRLAGCDIALVRLFPVQYLPASRQLLFAPKLTLTLTVTPANGASPTPAAVTGGLRARERVAAFVDNPDLLAEYPTAQPGNPAANSSSCDYLLVTKASLLPSFQPLLRRKAQDGLAVKAETLENITDHTPGRDVPEKLRNFIRHAHTDWGVQYVLLGGDTTTVPCRYAYAHSRETGAEARLPCDLYFACLDGSWNRDGDDRWGESTDGEQGDDVDLLAEVCVGRAPVDTAAEAGIFVEKTVRYEEQGHRNCGSVLLAAEYLGHFSPAVHAQGGDMFEPVLPYLGRCSVAWLDDRPHTAPQWNAAQAITALNRSPHFVLYSGHGESDAMMRLRPSDLDALTNRDPFLAYSVGCHAGRFDNDKFSPDSIAEELVKRHRGGAFAAIFNARLGWFDPVEEWKFSGEFQVKFFSELFSRGQTNLGRAFQAAKHDMLGHLETTGIMPYRWCCFEITLFGDPHTPLRLPPAPPRAQTPPQSTAPVRDLLSGTP